jgi:hypothetical protein
MLGLVTYLLAVVAGLAFGAGDQYLGSLSALGGWAAAVSLMSAPWLVVPFVTGMTQERGRRAMTLGLVVTLSALVGYIAMTYSPMENGAPRDFLRGVFTMARTEYTPVYVVSGMVTGPLYGLLGQRWRVARSWISAALITCPLCLEPLALRCVGRLQPHPLVYGVEIAIGAVAGVSFALVIATSRRARKTPPPPPPTI